MSEVTRWVVAQSDFLLSVKNKTRRELQDVSVEDLD